MMTAVLLVAGGHSGFSGDDGHGVGVDGGDKWWIEEDWIYMKDAPPKERPQMRILRCTNGAPVRRCGGSETGGASSAKGARGGAPATPNERRDTCEGRGRTTAAATTSQERRRASMRPRRRAVSGRSATRRLRGVVRAWIGRRGNNTGDFGGGGRVERGADGERRGDGDHCPIPNHHHRPPPPTVVATPIYATAVARNLPPLPLGSQIYRHLRRCRRSPPPTSTAVAAAAVILKGLALAAPFSPSLRRSTHHCSRRRSHRRCVPSERKAVAVSMHALKNAWVEGGDDGSGGVGQGGGWRWRTEKRWAEATTEVGVGGWREGDGV
ncbi:hypothetical protein Syun_000794 [Stephania yunnanensis]|uniref:Uncharacterized protein n=1 Tax=Stephania yunnanensis TaxID=152371 RepID=A0AAP0Q742_9MAGN